MTTTSQCPVAFCVVAVLFEYLKFNWLVPTTTTVVVVAETYPLSHGTIRIVEQIPVTCCASWDDCLCEVKTMYCLQDFSEHRRLHLGGP